MQHSLRIMRQVPVNMTWIVSRPAKSMVTMTTMNAAMNEVIRLLMVTQLNSSPSPGPGNEASQAPILNARSC